MVFATRYLRLMDPPMVGPDVSLTQGRLKALGIYEGEINGVFDEATAEAVRRFQQRNGLRVDGIVGPDTYNALQLGEAIDVWQSPRTGPRISIDLVRRRLFLYRAGVLLETFPVAIGKPSTPTPPGNWVIVDKQENPGGAFGARWMRLSTRWGGYGIHGTDTPESIGRAVSHGCVRMLNENVITVYNQAPLGTNVKIQGEAMTGRILRIGVEPADDVRLVQERLKALGYYRGDVDGFYGPLTAGAVMAFQRDRGLDPDGIVGPATYEELELAWDQATGDRRP
ncbi:MAG: L,D-transpeptidase family protein [Firmicutes bacterium]|nr:L,D-transpeptidase family protein [Bacillota bacterium]